jgi:hypothetical protein
LLTRFLLETDMRTGHFASLIVLTAAPWLSGPALASCGSAYCSLATTFDALGIRFQPGFRFDLRGEYVEQKTLRSGRDEVAPSGEPGTETEQRTINRNLVATLDYSWSPEWAIVVQVPYVVRTHDHIANEPEEGPVPESWDFNGLGDIRVIGRYQLNRPNGSAAGVRLGLSLPTGQTDITNNEGVAAERSLAPGTGTTGLIAGLNVNGQIGSSPAGYFASITGQWALNSHEDYRPGYQFLLNGGASYPVTGSLTGLLQLSALFKGHDQGAEAEPEDSGSEQLFLSPGVNLTLARNVWLYAFVQVPLYQNVNGTQLTADLSEVVGISTIW